MDNEIFERQNNKKAIELLGAQRQLYNEVKRIEDLRIFFAVFFPMILAVIELFVINNQILSIIIYISSIVSMLIGLMVSSYIKNKKRLAAEIQQIFDVYVYQMPWDVKLFGRERDINYSIIEYSKKLFRKAGEKEKLLNWYTGPVQFVDLNKGILICQKENFQWDVTLRKRFKKLSIIVVACFVVLIVIINLIKNNSSVMLLGMLAFFFPMIVWLVEIVKNIDGDIENLKECDDIMNSPGIKTMSELQEIQKHIYEHRKSCFVIPNWFYKKFKDNDEDTAHRVASRDINE
ncbi:MAG: S-4TM family putative pore-forming effector [Acidaminococcaceae bacterium]|nr:S-4TM family putative pore-forming effector [Acidaminococcaceae bacterium]